MVTFIVRFVFSMWLYHACRGVEYEPVILRRLAKSIGCSKLFPGKEKLDTKDKVRITVLLLLVCSSYLDIDALFFDMVHIAFTGFRIFSCILYLLDEFDKNSLLNNSFSDTFFYQIQLMHFMVCGMQAHPSCKIHSFQQILHFMVCGMQAHPSCKIHSFQQILHFMVCCMQAHPSCKIHSFQ